jgi:two-component system OmpR family response regulator
MPTIHFLETRVFVYKETDQTPKLLYGDRRCDGQHTICHECIIVQELSVTVQCDTHSPARILVVDEDVSTRGAIADYLADHSFVADTTSGQLGMASYFGRTEPDLVVLSVAQDHNGGLQPLVQIRSHSNVPVIVASGHESGEADSVIALELGADDYITRPFAFRELLARVGAVLRRDKASKRVHRDRMRRGYRFDGWQLDREQRSLVDPNGIRVQITKCECAVLLALVDASGRPLTRAQILDATRVHDDVFDRCVDVHIARLRRKLEADPSAPRIILTERGIGYLFGLPVEPL